MADDGQLGAPRDCGRGLRGFPGRGMCDEPLGSAAVVRRRIFFFFQAEDGIRDLTVTGVQTCALPICSLAALVLAWSLRSPWGWAAWQLTAVGLLALGFGAVRFGPPRAGLERRRRSPPSPEGGGVGKRGGFRGGRYL